MGRDWCGVLENRLEVGLTFNVNPSPDQTLSAHVNMETFISCTSVQRPTGRIDSTPFLFHHILYLSCINGYFWHVTMLDFFFFPLRQGKTIFCGCLCELFILFLSSNRNAYLSLTFPGWLLPCGLHAVI